jgi:hypothetical protein
MLVRAQVSARRRVLSVLPIDVSLFSVTGGDGVSSIDTTAKTITVTYGTTTTSRRAAVPVTSGKRYRISWAYSGTTSGMYQFAGTSDGGIQYRSPIQNDAFFDVTVTTATLHLGFQRQSAGTTTVSNITIQEIPEVTWTDTSLISPAGWTNLSAGVTVDQTTGAITIPAAGTTLSARQSFPTTVGKLYRLRWNITLATMCLIGTGSGGGQMKASFFSDVAGNLVYEFRPTTTTTWLQYQRTSSGTTVVSNIFVQEMV